jgi:UDP-N-acetylmuramyl pentapeptide phosphotransferase/UDP-N-acetylglucosamine-1-phosphate transferase
MTALLTGVATSYSRYAGLIDEPGERRSHQNTVPRGGGIAMIICLVSALLICRQQGWIGLPLFLTWLSPIMLVAAVGWWDDHTPLSAKFRILIHIFAVLTTIAGFVAAYGVDFVTGLAVFIGALWLLNLFNFMDGSHGLAAGQGIFAASVFAWLLHTAGHPDAAITALLLAAVSLGFLPWNFPRPKVFMGDVASGALGLAFAILGLWGYLEGSLTAAVIVLVLSTFIVDASLTLFNRMYRRQQWYTAHTEHAYQRLIAMGRGHTETFLLYQSVNVVVVLPGVVWMRYLEGYQWTIAGTIMIAQALAWFWVYRRSLLMQEKETI